MYGFMQTYIKKRIIRQFYKKVETTAIHSLQTIHALRIFFQSLIPQHFDLTLFIST